MIHAVEGCTTIPYLLVSQQLGAVHLARWLVDADFLLLQNDTQLGFFFFNKSDAEAIIDKVCPVDVRHSMTIGTGQKGVFHAPRLRSAATYLTLSHAWPQQDS